jgi:poly(3-hydroxybutyrate) depolymerase
LIASYTSYENSRLAAAPLRWSAQTTRTLLANPFNPWHYTPIGRALKAAATVTEGLLQQHGHPDWNLDAEMTVVLERPFCRLLRFSTGGGAERPRVLLVAPLSGHFATLLRPTVAALAGEHDVYLTDWANARDVPVSAGAFGLDDYIDYLIEDMRYLGPDAHVIAVCQPCPAVLAAIAVMAANGDPAQPRSMTLMGGPVDTRVAPTTPTELALSRPLSWFSDELIATVPGRYAGAGRRVYPCFVQIGAFLSMHPGRHIDAHIDLYHDLVRGDTASAHRRQAFYDEYLAVMDVSAQYFLETVDAVFQRHALPLGTLTHRGERVDLTAIRNTALLTVEGELDDISAVGQTGAAHGLTPNVPDGRRGRHIEPGVGHYGIFSGSRWRTNIAPLIADFIRRT